MDHPDMLGRQLAPLSFSWVSTASRQLETVWANLRLSSEFIYDKKSTIFAQSS